jgi:hypothetical protein
MIKAFLEVLAVGLIPMFSRAAAVELPNEVSSFLEERESCAHWRGEEGYNKERRAEIDWSICQSCPGTDSKPSVLRKKYRTDKVIMEKLTELEPRLNLMTKVRPNVFVAVLKSRSHWMTSNNGQSQPFVNHHDMRIIFIMGLIAMLLGVLWAPACLVSRKFSTQGDAPALRTLRVILPSQLVAAVVLVFLADAIGLRNPVGLVVAIVFDVSLLGAGILLINRLLRSRTQ